MLIIDIIYHNYYLLGVDNLYMKKGGWYPNAFMKYMEGDEILVNFRGKRICKYKIGNERKSDLQHVFLLEENLDYYIESGRVYCYSHNSGKTNLIYCDSMYCWTIFVNHGIQKGSLWTSYP